MPAKEHMIQKQEVDIISQKPAIILIIAGLFCMILLAGCVLSPQNQPAQTRKVNTPSGSTVEKDVAVLIPQFDAYAGQIFNKSKVPGMAVAVVKDDSVIYLRTFGVKNLTTREPVSPDTRFQLASISKTFSSASIASMVGKGELSWDDRVVPLYPGFRLSDPWITDHVTVRDLLMHRTGLPAYAGDELQDIGYNRSEIISKLRLIPLMGDYRSSYAYSNIGITSAAEAAAKKAGMSWEDLVSERVIVPAGMKNTSARFADFENAADRVDTYSMMNGTPVAGPLLNDDVNSPAGGVSSTINDMARYARLQLNDGSIDGKQVIDAAALKETHRPQNIMKTTNNSITAYDLGWESVAEKGRIRVEHGGDLTSGVSTYITLYPEEKMAIVVLTNGFPGGHILKKAVINGWDDLYFTGAVQKDWYSEIETGVAAAMKPGASAAGPLEPLPPSPAGAQPSRPATAYQGSYSQDYYGTLRVEPDAGGLRLYAGHLTEPFFLVPYDGDTFREKGTGTAVKFTTGSNGSVTGVHVVMFEHPWVKADFVKNTS
jgi:CubicO group peptidase (beta-lactamase class C family)